MKALVEALIVQRFTPAGPAAVSRALCTAKRESGFNPGAVSRTDDHGVAQFNYPSHRGNAAIGFGPWPTARVYDPVHNVGEFWAMSKGGRDWGPWNGGCSG